MRRQHTMNGARNRVGRGAAALLTAGLAASAFAAAADAATPLSGPDPDFGGTGSVLTDFTGGEDGAEAVAVAADGGIVAVGFADLGDATRPHVAGFGVARYLPGGAPDPAFSGDGRTLVDFGFVNQGATSVAVDSEGRIVATGTITTFDGSTSSIGVARLLPDGSPDPSFGGGDGEVVVQPGTLSASYDAAIDGENGIVLLGAATGSKGFRPTLIGFGEDGSLDPGFGWGGIERFAKAFSDDYRAMAVDGRGRLLLAGTSDGRPSVLRRLPAGDPDPSYGVDGAGEPLGRGVDDVADIALDGSGRAVVVATSSRGRRKDDDMAVARLTLRGRADRRFSRDGRAYAGFGRNDARASSLAVDPEGRIVAGGSVLVSGRKQWALARLGPNGRPVDSLSADIGAGVDGVRDVATDFDSRVLAVGLGIGPQSSDFAVARFR